MNVYVITVEDDNVVTTHVVGVAASLERAQELVNEDFRHVPGAQPDHVFAPVCWTEHTVPGNWHDSPKQREWRLKKWWLEYTITELPVQ